MFIKIKDLTKNYNNFCAVNKINFQIEKNKTIGLLHIHHVLDANIE